MTTTTREIVVPTAVAAFLERLGTADWSSMAEHLDSDVLYDASVPGWRYQYRGARRVLQEYREEWSGRYRWTIAERHVVASDDAAALLIEMHGAPVRASEHQPVVCRVSNLFRLDGSRITEHRLTCCGEWGPETVRKIDDHAPMVEGRPE